MRIGTSLRLKFKIDLDDFAYTNVKRVELTMRQAYKNVLIRNLVIDEDCFYIDLSEEEMYLFQPEKVRMQLKMVYPDGKVIATCIYERVIKNMLNKEVTTNLELQEESPRDPQIINMHIEEEFVTGEGTNDYNRLFNKPSINGTTLEGDLTLKDLGIVTPSVEDENLLLIFKEG